MSKKTLTHLNTRGEAHMVDVADKKVSARAACPTQNRLSFMATNPTMEEHLRDADDDFGVNFAKVKTV